MRWKILLVVVGCLPLLAHAATPEGNFLQRPIRLIIGFPPGGATDLVGRLVADKLAERFGQQVVVDNRPGASGIVAARMVAGSQPDGHTLLISGSSISIVGTLLKEAHFDVQRDLQPLAMVATSAYVLVVHPSTGVKTVTELVAYARPRAGKLSYGASTPGTVQHLSTEMLKRLAGIDLLFVPYKTLNAEIFTMMDRPEVRERLLGFGATPLAGTPDDLRAQLAREVPRWRKVIEEAGIKGE